MRYERERKNMGEPKCIYCGTSKDLSNSDIIPDALTASRIINKCVCHVEHNSGMTKKFESEVAEKLAFLLNYLNIKSKKSNHFPTYEADYVIAGIRYHDKKVVKEHDFINKKILWSENNESAFGPYEKIEQIAKSKKTNKGDIKIRLFDDFKNSYIYNCKNKTPFLNKQGRGINPRGTTLVIPEKRRVSPLSFNAGVRHGILIYFCHIAGFPKDCFGNQSTGISHQIIPSLKSLNLRTISFIALTIFNELIILNAQHSCQQFLKNLLSHLH